MCGQIQHIMPKSKKYSCILKTWNIAITELHVVLNVYIFTILYEKFIYIHNKDAEKDTCKNYYS